MPKKKQVTFQNNIPGKFIPRDDTSSTSGMCDFDSIDSLRNAQYILAFRSGTNPSRFNSKMVELLASSSPVPSTITDENESISTTTKITHDDSGISTSSELTTVDSSRVHSKLLHRRIVTMLENLRRRGGATSPPTSPRLTTTHIDSKSQPITFGQLRQATTPSSPPPIPSRSKIVEEVTPPITIPTRSYTDLLSMNSSDLISNTSKHLSNQDRLFYSPSLEQLLEQHHIVSRKNEQTETKQDEQQQPKPPLTVDEILATYYSKVKSTNYDRNTITITVFLRE